MNLAFAGTASLRTSAMGAATVAADSASAATRALAYTPTGTSAAATAAKLDTVNPFMVQPYHIGGRRTSAGCRASVIGWWHGGAAVQSEGERKGGGFADPVLAHRRKRQR